MVQQVTFKKVEAQMPTIPPSAWMAIAFFLAVNLIAIAFCFVHVKKDYLKKKQEEDEKNKED